MEQFVIKALQKGVTAAVVGSLLPETSVKYIGKTFETPENGKWLEIVHIPNNRVGQFWSDGKTYQGVMRLLYHSPEDNRGIYDPLSVLQSVLTGLPKGSKLKDDPTTPNVTITITEKPNVLNIIEESPNLLIPVSVRYSFFKP